VASSFKKIAVGGTPVGINIEGDFNHAMVTVEGDSVRYRIDGDDPDATTGHLTKSVILLEGRGELTNCRVISTGNSILQITCDKRSNNAR